TYALPPHLHSFPTRRSSDLRAAPDVNVHAVARLQLAYGRDDVTLEAHRVLPFELRERAGCDVLRRRVETRADGIVVMVRPVGGKDLIGAPPQQQVERLRHHADDGVPRFLARIWRAPAAVPAPAARILLRPARGLHHPVQ